MASGGSDVLGCAGVLTHVSSPGILKIWKIRSNPFFIYLSSLGHLIFRSGSELESLENLG